MGEVVVADPRQGEVWWGESPEQKGRPYLVILRDAALPRMHRVLVAPVTTRVRNISSELPLGPEDGLLTDCVANFDNIRAFPKSLLVRQLGSVSPGRRNQICRALLKMAGC